MRMIGSNDVLQPPAVSAADAGSAAARGLSDQECVERLQVVMAEHASVSPAESPVGNGQGDDLDEAGQLREVAALIGRLAVPLEY
jgi:hypothetical protein